MADVSHRRRSVERPGAPGRSHRVAKPSGFIRSTIKVGEKTPFALIDDGTREHRG
ncbi:hypothetical protein MKY25_03105 [Geobacillus sp. FSL W8-0032]|uniref:hypothetical protein n=1 Tax=Geobacillus TaxID=129337 RepID=UPI000A5AA55E|nr:hypothetical protein [Geobacillus icigianus]